MLSWEADPDRQFGVSRCELLHLEWINNKVLLRAQGTISNLPE